MGIYIALAIIAVGVFGLFSIAWLQDSRERKRKQQRDLSHRPYSTKLPSGSLPPSGKYHSTKGLVFPLNIHRSGYGGSRMNAQQWTLLIASNLVFLIIAGVIAYSFWQDHGDHKNDQ